MTEQFHTTPFLTPEAREAASKASNYDRQMMINNLLYPYPMFKDAVTFIRDFHKPVTDGVHAVGQIGGLLGPSRVGKSHACKFFQSEIPSVVKENGEVYPVVYLQASDDMKPSSMGERICASTGARSLGTMKVTALIDATIKRLHDNGTELLIIDDAQFMFFNRHRNDVANFKSFIKLLSDQKFLNILLVGDERIKELIQGTDYLSGRGSFPSRNLQPLSELGNEFDQFRMFLRGIDYRLPFKTSSNLSDEKIAAQMFLFSGGLIGRVMNLVQRASYNAINEQTSCIMVEHLREASNTLIGQDPDYKYFRVV